MTEPGLQIAVDDGLTGLRGYQRRAVRDVRRAMGKVRRVLLVEFMGSGKTVMAASLVRSFVAGGGRVLVLTHRAEILKQTIGKLVRAGIAREQIGVIWGARAGMNLAAPVQVASVATLVRRDAPKGITHVIVDEAHHAHAASWRKILEWYPGAKVLGLTATPERLDGKPLGDFFEEMVVGEPAQNLIEDGWLSRPEIWTREDGWRPERLARRGADYAREEAARVMMRSTIVGGIPRAYLKHAKGLPCVLFAATKAQATALVEVFRSAGVAAETIFDDDTEREREAKLLRLRSKRTSVLCTCDILGEGWDYDGCRCVIMARPTASLSRYMQWAGRCMRKGRPPSIILDHAGNFYRFGPPWEERDWSLTGSVRGTLLVPRVDPSGQVTFAEPIEVDGKLVRADHVQRQTVCPGFNGPCPGLKKPPRRAFSPFAVANRKGEEWRCRNCAGRKCNAARTPEQRSEAVRKGTAARTPEQRSEAVRKGNAARTPEQRSEAVRKGNAARTPEQRSEAVRKGNAARTPEQRSEVARKANAARTPEQRSEVARKVWITRRRR